MLVFFLIVPIIIAAGAILMAVMLTRRSMEVRRAWGSGLTAQARCVRAYTTTSRNSSTGTTSTTQHHVFEFAAGDGRPVRFDEPHGSATTVEGDVVTVYYAADRPERATAHAPRPAGNVTGLVFTLAFLGFVVAFCVFFVVVVARMF